MATLNPKISLCLSNSCKFSLNDVAGIYSTANPNGYKNSLSTGGVDITDWNTGVIKIFKYNTDTEVFSLTTVDSGSSFTMYPTEATSNMPLGDYNFSSPDGVYDLVYSGSLLNGNVLTEFKTTLLMHCKASACIDKLKSTYALKPTEENLDKVILAQTILDGALALFTCNQVLNADKVTQMLNKICKIDECGCGC